MPLVSDSLPLRCTCLQHLRANSIHTGFLLGNKEPLDSLRYPFAGYYCLFARVFRLYLLHRGYFSHLPARVLLISLKEGTRYKIIWNDLGPNSLPLEQKSARLSWQMFLWCEVCIKSDFSPGLPWNPKYWTCSVVKIRHAVEWGWRAEHSLCDFGMWNGTIANQEASWLKTETQQIKDVVTTAMLSLTSWNSDFCGSQFLQFSNLYFLNRLRF